MRCNREDCAAHLSSRGGSLPIIVADAACPSALLMGGFGGQAFLGAFPEKQVAMSFDQFMQDGMAMVRVPLPQ